MCCPEPVRLCTADDIVLSADYYSHISGGPVYVLGHGFTGSARNARLAAVAARLHERGASVLALDFRGHGASEGLSTIGVSETADIAAAVAWVRARQPGVPVVTLGFSMGASVVVRHAGLGGSTDLVIAVSGPGRWYERGTEPMRRLHFGVETRLGRWALDRFFHTRVGGGWDLLPVSPVEVASAITQRLLVVHGDADPYFGVDHPRMLAAAAPNSELWLEPGMGHAENATSIKLLDRMDDWARAELARSGTMTA